MPEAQAKTILHIDLDCFFVSVERIFDPSFKGKPVLVSGNPEGRGVVSSASYEARKFGVRSAMPIQKARKLCPQCIVLPVRMGAYAEFSERVFALLREFTPLVEEASIDEAYLDLTGTDKLFGPALAAAEKIQKRVSDELGLPSSIGIGSNKLIAKIASQLAKPGGIIEVPAGKEKDFLAELSIGVIPGVGGKTEKRLEALAAKKVKHILQLGRELMERHFGKWGAELWQKASGLGETEVIAEEEAPKSLGKEVTFDQDLGNLAELEEWLYSLVVSLGIRLRKRGLYAGRVSLKLRSPDFKTWTRTARLDTATNQDSELYAAAVKILEKENRPGFVLRLIGIYASDLSPVREVPLFQKDEIEKKDRLFRALDQTRERFGRDSIYPARIRKIMHEKEKEDGDEN